MKGRKKGRKERLEERMKGRKERLEDVCPSPSGFSNRKIKCVKGRFFSSGLS